MRPVSWRAEQKRGQDDAVFDTNGSITDNTSLGDLDTPVTEDHRYAPSAALWKQGASQFAELPYDMVFTEQYSVRCAQVAAYHFLGFPEQSDEDQPQRPRSSRAA